MKIYGSMLCPDCVRCRKDLDEKGIDYEYLDFADSLRNLKEFLALRDRNPVITKIKEEGRIGIPCILLPDGTVTLNWDN